MTEEQRNIIIESKNEGALGDVDQEKLQEAERLAA